MNSKYIRSLQPQQKSAYDGAKDFYVYFVPIFVIYCTILQTVFSHLNYLNLLMIILSYVLAKNMYMKCHQIGNQPYQLRVKLLKEEISEEKIQQQFQHELCEDDTLVNIQIKQQRPKKFHCKRCNIITPYRTRHCKKCNTCVLRFDHHCFWIGNCVGQNNHFHFYLFLIYQTVNNFCTAYQDYQLLWVLQGYWWTTVLFISFLSFGFLFFTGYLSCYHTMLVMTNMTTWQHMSRQKITYLKYLKIGHNPFSKGIKKNILEFFSRQWCDQKNGKNWQIPTYQEAKLIEPGFNLISNQYYSCC